MDLANRAVTVRDLHNMLYDTDIEACFKRWLYCGGHFIPVCCGGWSKLDCSFVLCFEETEYEKDHWPLLRLYDGQSICKLPRSNIILRRPFCHLYFSKLFIIVRGNATSSSVCDSLAGTYLWRGITSKYLLFPQFITQFITKRSRFMVGVKLVLYLLQSDASGLYILLSIYPKSFSSS